ncbi:LexA family transcriptional regulator [Mannheimia indoligenes]|uniref:S24 family peptidase n=1 Tax=Mannheimia indoligenes TaxID=3103145 RepID=A0ABU7ZE63_9PAST
MKKHWNELIRQEMSAKNLKQDDLAEALDRTQGSIGHWLTGRRTPNFDDVAKMLNVVGIDRVVLNSDGLISTLDEEELEIVGKPKNGIIPVVGEAMMGRDETLRLEELRTGYINLYSSDSEAYAVRGKGSSMEPRIKSGEYIVLEPNTPALNGDDVLVCTVNDEYMIKTLDWHRNGEYRFSSINNDHPPFNLQDNEVRYVHTVGAIVKASRFISFEDFEQ